MKQARKEVSGVLFGIAALQLVCGFISVLILPAMAAPQVPLPPEAIIFSVCAVVGLGVIYVGLGIWARYHPLPPAVIGLVLYVGVTLLDFLVAPGVILSGIWIKIIILIALIRAVLKAATAR
jgi:hypothetical protein